MADKLILTRVRGTCPDDRTCPAAHKTSRGTVMIVGRPVTEPEALAQMAIGDGEIAIEVPGELFPEVD